VKDWVPASYVVSGRVIPVPRGQVPSHTAAWENSLSAGLSPGNHSVCLRYGEARGVSGNI